MKAIIIGAGIGGLTAAATLRRVGVDVEVYERAGELRAAGSALSFSINARTALRTLGIELDLARRGRVYHALDFLTTKGRRIRRIQFGHIGERLGAQNIAIHRADLQQALLEHCAGTPIRLGATATRFQVDAGGVRVEFADGHAARGDVLIGADGFNSVIRQQLVGPEATREPGYVCWLATLPFRHPVVTDGYCAHYWGRGQRFGLADLGGGRVYWWGTKNEPAGDGKDDILRAYAGWAPEVVAAIAATPSEAIISVPARDRPFLEHWGRGPVTLLGDAAHPMLPSLAQGAAQAVEDAVVLAHHLGGSSDVDSSLRGYEAERKERARAMVDGSFALSRIEQLDHPVSSLLRNLYMRFMRQSVIDGRNEAAMTFTLMSDQGIRERARAAFAKNLEYLETGRIRERVDLFEPDGVLEFAFCPPGVPSRYAGHEALYEQMKAFPELLEVRFSDLIFHDTEDPELVIAEFRADCTAVPTGRAFQQTYISVVRTRNGKFVHFKDFWNPLPVIEALGMGPIDQADAA